MNKLPNSFLDCGAYRLFETIYVLFQFIVICSDLSSCLSAAAIQKLHDSIDARLTLSSMLLEEGRDDEAISVLSPPVESGIPYPFLLLNL